MIVHEITGSGPLLVLVPGGPADSNVFAAVRQPLAEHHTVVTYDPRGLGASTAEDPTADVLARHADDLHALLAEFGEPAASVFATSGGAMTALTHLLRHPGEVATLVVHEPPITRYLGPFGGPDIPRLYREEGLVPAISAFHRAIGIDAPPGEPDPGTARNFGTFFGHLMAAIGAYEPDVDALKSSATRIIVAVGEDSAGQPAHRGGLGLAADLGVPVETVPGDHGGYLSDPAAFATRLHELIA